jgi:hypothetical protein
MASWPLPPPPLSPLLDFDLHLCQQPKRPLEVEDKTMDDSLTNTSTEDDENTNEIGQDDRKDNNGIDESDRKDNPLPVPVSIKNDDSTVVAFRFRVNGNKELKGENGRGSMRKYYRCSEKSCEAQYYVTTPANGKITTTFLPKPHNHYPPVKPRTCMVVKEKALSHFSVGAHPSVVHKQFVNNAPLPLSGTDVPSLSQLKNWKYRVSMDGMPSGLFFLSLLFFLFSDFINRRRILQHNKKAPHIHETVHSSSQYPSGPLQQFRVEHPKRE